MSYPHISQKQARDPSSAQKAPGPPAWQALRMMPELQRNPLRLFTDLVQAYGDLVRFQFLPRPVFLVTHPDHIKSILQEKNHLYNKDVFNYHLLKHFLGNGLLTNDGEAWLMQRRLIQPAFHRQRIAAFGELMVQTTLAHIERWEPLAQKEEPLDIAAEMMQLTLHIVSRALFSTDITDSAETIGAEFNLVNRHMTKQASSPFLPLFVPTPSNLRFKKAVHTLEVVVYDIIRRRRERKLETDDLLSLLLSARDETGEGMNDQQVHDEVMTLMLAGHETTANALSWTFWLLWEHPEVEHRFQEEIREVLQGRPPTVEDMSNLKYTRMMIEESMRLYPPSWVLSRNAAVSHEMGGYLIPAQSPLFLIPYLTHRHPDFWEDPLRFDPERFTPERIAARPRYAYVPFGGGPRQCIGNTFAMTEAQLILATIAQRYKLTLSPGQTVVPDPLITLRPRNGLLMLLQSR